MNRADTDNQTTLEDISELETQRRFSDADPYPPFPVSRNIPTGFLSESWLNSRAFDYTCDEPHEVGKRSMTEFQDGSVSDMCGDPYGNLSQTVPVLHAATPFQSASSIDVFQPEDQAIPLSEDQYINLEPNFGRLGGEINGIEGDRGKRGKGGKRGQGGEEGKERGKRGKGEEGEDTSSMDQFWPEDEPAPLPQDEEFKWELNTLQVLYTGPASQLGNHIIKYRDAEADIAISVLKVTRKKFSAKFYLFLRNNMCTIKLRIYRDLSRDMYLIEFQRRSGDVLAFNTAYNIIGHSLGRMCSIVEGLPPPMAIPTWSSIPASKVSCDAFEPLVQMATSKVSALQAEVASALADLAVEQGTVMLSNASVLDTLCELISCDEIAIGYPASRAFALLTPLMDAKFLSRNVCIRSAISEQYFSSKTAHLVRQKLKESWEHVGRLQAAP